VISVIDPLSSIICVCVCVCTYIHIYRERDCFENIYIDCFERIYIYI
jgi:hypothetical protein